MVKQSIKPNWAHGTSDTKFAWTSSRKWRCTMWREWEGIGGGGEEAYKQAGWVEGDNHY